MKAILGKVRQFIKVAALLLALIAACLPHDFGNVVALLLVAVVA